MLLTRAHMLRHAKQHCWLLLHRKQETRNLRQTRGVHHCQACVGALTRPETPELTISHPVCVCVRLCGEREFLTSRLKTENGDWNDWTSLSVLEARRRGALQKMQRNGNYHTRHTYINSNVARSVGIAPNADLAWDTLLWPPKSNLKSLAGSKSAVTKPPGLSARPVCPVYDFFHSFVGFDWSPQVGVLFSKGKSILRRSTLSVRWDMYLRTFYR